MGKGSIVLGVLNDIHIIGIQILEHVLLKNGYIPVRIGAMVTQEELINTAIETNAKAIFVSSSNGHAVIEFNGLREKCQEAGLDNILLYAGGYLVVTKQLENWDDIIKRFEEMGYNRIYRHTVLPEEVMKDLDFDLGYIG